MDALVERLSRTVAQRTSRRGFLGYLGKALVGGMMIPLLPINRVVEQAQAQMSGENGAAAEGEGGDLTSCDLVKLLCNTTPSLPARRRSPCRG